MRITRINASKSPASEDACVGCFLLRMPSDDDVTTRE